jgi:hypothetical protein
MRRTEDVYDKLQQEPTAIGTVTVGTGEDIVQKIKYALPWDSQRKRLDKGSHRGNPDMTKKERTKRYHGKVGI